MTPELREKLKPQNLIVKTYQEGKLTDKEFYRLLDDQRADRLQDEMDEIDLKEVMEAEAFAEKAEEEQRQQYEDSVR